MNAIKKIQFGANGMAGDVTLKRVFADVQIAGSHDLFTKFAEVHEEITGKECSHADSRKIFAKP